MDAIREYARTKLDPVLKPLVETLLRERPPDVVEAMILALQGLKTDAQALASPMRASTGTHGEMQYDAHIADALDSPPVQFNRGRRRTGISAEPVNMSDMASFTPIVVPKSEHDKLRILDSVSDNILFSSLDSEQLNVIADSLQQKSFTSGEDIIVQGETTGDYFYIMDSGEADCFVMQPGCELPGKHVKVYHSGESFGELALMYNSPRAATIRAKTDCRCWALDRNTFRRMLMSTTGERQKKYEEFLGKVPILESLNKNELSKIADALIERKFADGDFAVRQGHHGDTFFIITKGEARVLKSFGDGIDEVELAHLKVGDCFGEVALITDNPRAANVVAHGQLTCVTLDRGAFTRLLGPIRDILKRNHDRYVEMEQKLYNERLEAVRELNSLNAPELAGDGDRSASQVSNRRRRTAVSSEPVRFMEQAESCEPTPVFPKTKEQRDRILKSITENFLFKSLSTEQLDIVINAMFEKKFRKGEVIIQEGDDGDFFYILDKGEAKCYVSNGEKDSLLVKVYSRGGSFGELALMYNSPRQATIIASGKNCTCWAVDRATFRRVLMSTTNTQRRLYEDFLQNVDILESLDRFERAKIADCLIPIEFDGGDYVIHQGDHGDSFYIIEEGNAIATKSFDGKPPVEVFRYSRGDYFGELALLNDEPRAANVIAVGKLRLVSMDRDSFVRLMGPCDDILKRNTEKYRLASEQR